MSTANLGTAVATVYAPGKVPTFSGLTPLPWAAANNKAGKFQLLGRVGKFQLLGQNGEGLPLWARLAIGTLGTVGMAAGAYHGYKRNNSVGWAIGWALLGGMFPVITIPVSLAQGFGKRKGR